MSDLSMQHVLLNNARAVFLIKINPLSKTLLVTLTVNCSPQAQANFLISPWNSTVPKEAENELPQEPKIQSANLKSQFAGAEEII
jgi:hypothetical protein